jgi:type I restriction enzyme S subunit
VIWPVARLSAVCDFENGDRGQNYPSKSALQDEGVPFVNAGDLHDGSLCADGLNYISPAQFQKLSNGKFREGDFLFCLRGSLGKFAMIDRPIRGAIASSLVIIRPRSDIHPGYLNAYLGSDLCLQQIALYRNGAAQPNLAAASLKQFEIPLPPFPVQRRIAAILDKTDALRRKRKRAIELLDGLTQSIFLEMFGRPGDPASKIDQRPLGRLAELINGDRSSNYPSGNDLVESGVLFLNTTNITKYGLDLTSANYITQAKFASLTRGKLKPGDIVVTLRGSLGQTAIFEDAGNTGFINAQMMIIRPTKEIVGRYLLQALQLDEMLAYFKRIGSGSAVPQLTAKQMSLLLIPLPAMAEQQEFGRRCRVIQKTRMRLLAQNRFADALFFSLQHRAFSGEL